jgi:hypothetical protein
VGCAAPRTQGEESSLCSSILRHGGTATIGGDQAFNRLLQPCGGEAGLRRYLGAHRAITEKRPQGGSKQSGDTTKTASAARTLVPTFPNLRTWLGFRTWRLTYERNGSDPQTCEPVAANWSRSHSRLSSNLANRHVQVQSYPLAGLDPPLNKPLERFQMPVLQEVDQRSCAEGVVRHA